MLNRLVREVMDWSPQVMLVLAGILLGSAARYFLGAPETQDSRLRFETPLTVQQQAEESDQLPQAEPESGTSPKQTSISAPTLPPGH